MGSQLHRSGSHAVSNHIRESKYPLHYRSQLITYLHVFPVTGFGTSYVFGEAVFVHFSLLFRSPRVRYLDMVILPFPFG